MNPAPDLNLPDCLVVVGVTRGADLGSGGSYRHFIGTGGSFGAVNRPGGCSVTPIIAVSVSA